MICFFAKSFKFSVFILGLVFSMGTHAQGFSYLNKFRYPISDTSRYQPKYYQQSFENQDSLVVGIYTLDHNISGKKIIYFDKDKKETMRKEFFYDSLGSVEIYREKGFDLEYEFTIGFYPNGILKSRKVSKAGKEVKAEFFDELGNPTDPPNGAIPFPYGGQEGWNKYLAKNLKFPLNARSRRKSGTVYIYFGVDKEGYLVNPEIMNPEEVYPPLAKEALRVINAYPHKWTPAQQDGVLISSFMRIPIRFYAP
ncbi:MAG: energy transducer TonB [Cyclobacteriaceae bacterium]